MNDYTEINGQIIEAAKAEAQVTEQTETWAGWKALGYEVVHGSKALFQARIHSSRTKSGWFTASFFGNSQVQAIGA